MNALLIVIGVLLLFAAIFYIIMAEATSRAMSIPKYKSYEETIRRAKEDENSYGDFDSYEKEPFTLPLRDGYEIHGDILPLDPNKVVIISHGHGDNKYTGIRFVQVFRNLGYTTVIYDLRGHGNNVRVPTTMGKNEARDLAELIDYFRKRYPDAILGLFGLSMGAATTAAALEYQPNVDFAVCDCGYGSLRQLAKDTLKQNTNIPAFMAGTVGFWIDMRYGYDLDDVNPTLTLEDNEIPICFIHGTEDTTVPAEHSKAMYENNKGYKELHLIEGTGHADAWLHDPEEYEKIIREFLDKALPKPVNETRDTEAE